MRIKSLHRLGMIAATAAALSSGCSKRSENAVTVRYAITPYQDSALPVVAHELGWYREQSLNVELVPVAWGDVMTALSGGAIDVAIYNFNSFQAPYENVVKGSIKPVFYCPVFLFKGQAIMVQGDRGLQVFGDASGQTEEIRNQRLVDVVRQLKGKRIAVTEGTELEQIVLAALQKANLSTQDVTLIHASPEDSLAAFLSRNVDAFAAGLTERVEARRRGAIELLTTADVMLPVVDGIITTEAFAGQHKDVLDKLVRTWFRTIKFMDEDLNKNSNHIRAYLAKSASTRYSPEEYAVAWTFDVFPRDAHEANELFNHPASRGYWKTAWDANNKFLLEQGKITSPVPSAAYWGEDVLRRLSNEK
jgi:ABC-type nitrate/sulfonate/bicarbonate transport system substrate-binding protein